METAMMVTRPGASTSASADAGAHELTRTAAVKARMTLIDQHPAWETLSQITMTMRAEVRLDRFRVQDLLALAEGQVFESASPDTEDVPICVGSVQLGWGEFEVIEQRMALRITRLG